VTHTLHRRGSLEELQKDYLIFATGAIGINREGAGPKLARVLQIMLGHNPVIYGNIFGGNTLTASADHILERMQQGATGVIAVFNNEEAITDILRELKERDFGLCIIVSGLFDHVHECCRDAGLEPHTVNISGGILGKLEKLPSDPILEVNTLCGHGLVSFNLIKKKVEEIRAKRTTAVDAAKTMARNCHCGMFNWERAARILSHLASEERPTS